MGSKAKSKQIVNRLMHSYLNVMKLENYGPTGECLNYNHQTSQKVFFTITLKIQKVQKWQALGILTKNQIKYYVL